jgi:hypothetical protein
MKTLADMERELKQLRARVGELEGTGREQQTVDELLSNDDDGSQPSNSGFARACAEANEELCEKLERQAIAVCRSDSLKNPVALQGFRIRFQRLGRTKLDELINTYCEP